jgi:hypothetical protein
METAEHREPCESRGSRTDLGAPGGEIPPGDSTDREDSGHDADAIRNTLIQNRQHSDLRYPLPAQLRCEPSGQIMHEAKMAVTDLIIGDIKVRAVVAPLKRPVRPAVGTIPSAPLVLIDVLTQWPVGYLIREGREALPAASISDRSARRGGIGPGIGFACGIALGCSRLKRDEQERVQLYTKRKLCACRFCNAT